MPRAKSQIGGWGGRRKGAGRKRKLPLSDRRKIASDYFARKQENRDLEDNAASRDAIIRELAAKYGVTYRMVMRCLDEFLRENQITTKKCGGTQRRGTGYSRFRQKKKSRS